MEANQARQLIKRLYDAYGRTAHEGQAQVYLSQLTPLPFDLAEAAVNEAIAKERYFPSVAVLKDYIRAVTAEGIPGASAYGSRVPPGRTPTEWALLLGSLRQEEKLLAMSDADYMEYLGRYRIHHGIGRGGNGID